MGLTVPEFVGLGSFRRAFVEDDRFRHALWLTVYFTGLVTGLQLVLGVTLALPLNRPFRGKGWCAPSSSSRRWPRRSPSRWSG